MREELRTTPVQYNMTYQIVRLMFLAGLAFAAPDFERVKRGYGNSGSGASSGSYASSSSSSSAGGVGGGAGGIACAFIGQLGSGGYTGSGNTGGPGYSDGGTHSGYNSGGGSSSAISSSSAGSLSGGGGGGAYGKPSGYSSNTIPAGAYGNGNIGGGYASGYPGGSYAGSGAAPGYGGPGNAPGFGGPGSGGAGLPFNMPAGCFSGFPNFGPDPYQIHQEIMKNLNRIHEENLRFGAGSGGGGGYNGGPPGSQGGGGNVGAFASGSIGPQGGSGYAGVYPSDGVGVRFGETAPPGAVQSVSGNIPPPSGSFYGVSTSSQSGSSTVDGQTKTYKKSKVTVNDDGKVTTYTASDP